MFEKMFKLKEKGTTVKTEVIAGVTTFLAMAYILAVNPTMLKEAGLSYDGVFLATALSAGIATLIMGLLANYPVALAPGMGVNALFTYTIVLTMGYSPEAALAAVVVSGLIFLIISVTGIRKAIINAIPHQLKLSIGAGIGFFIAFIGFKNAGIIVGSDSTFVALGDLTNPVVLLALFGILITIILMAKKVPAAVFYGLVITAVVGIIFGFPNCERVFPVKFFSRRSHAQHATDCGIGKARFPSPGWYLLSASNGSGFVGVSFAVGVWVTRQALRRNSSPGRSRRPVLVNVQSQYMDFQCRVLPHSMCPGIVFLNDFWCRVHGDMTLKYVIGERYGCS